MIKIVLASSSPRRSQLLTQIGLNFEVIEPDIDETDGIIRSIPAGKVFSI